MNIPMSISSSVQPDTEAVIMTWLRTLIFLFNLACISHGRGVDLTLLRDARGADVVRSVQSRLDDANLFDGPSTTAEQQVYELFVRETAYVESLDGAEYPLGIRDGGIWRVSRDIFQQTQGYNLTDLFNGVCRTFCINWRDVEYDDLRSPLYSGLALNIYLHHLYNTNERLLQTATDMDRAVFWATSLGESRQVTQWLSRIAKLRSIEGIVSITQLATSIKFGSYIYLPPF